MRTGSISWRSCGRARGARSGFAGLKRKQPPAPTPASPGQPEPGSTLPRHRPGGNGHRGPLAGGSSGRDGDTRRGRGAFVAVPRRCYCFSASPNRRALPAAALSCGSLCLPPPPSASVCPFDPCLAARAAAPPPACFPLLLGCEEQCLSAAGLWGCWRYLPRDPPPPTEIKQRFYLHRSTPWLFPGGGS